MMYKISWANGDPDEIWATEADARFAIEAAYPGAEIGHPGDMSTGGPRTLAWASEEDAEEDDGTRAVAQITREEK